MKRFKLVLITSLLIVSCKSSQSPKYSTEPMEVETLIGEEGETVVLGFMNRANLNTDEFMAWFHPEYEMLNIPEGWIKEHVSLAKNLEFKLFLGTWGGDTQREVGGMFKILDALGVSEKQMEIYAISEANIPKVLDTISALSRINSISSFVLIIIPDIFKNQRRRLRRLLF